MCNDRKGKEQTSKKKWPKREAVNSAEEKKTLTGLAEDNSPLNNSCSQLQGEGQKGKEEDSRQEGVGGERRAPWVKKRPVKRSHLNYGMELRHYQKKKLSQRRGGPDGVAGKEKQPDNLSKSQRGGKGRKTERCTAPVETPQWLELRRRTGKGLSPSGKGRKEHHTLEKHLMLPG